jgi:hypothetical protein
MSENSGVGLRKVHCIIVFENLIVLRGRRQLNLVLRIKLICFGSLLFCDVLNIVNVYIIVMLYYIKSFNISKRKSEVVSLRRTENALDKSKTTTIQTIHRK